MYDRRLVAGGAAIALVMLAVVTFVLVAPRLALSAMNGLAQRELTRSVTARGGIHLDMSPLAIRIDDASFSGPTPEDDSFITAKSAVIPVSLAQLFGGKPGVSSLTLSEAEVALLINERGEANWDLPGFTQADPLRITLEQARFRFFDARNNQTMALDHVDGILDLRPDGGASFSGSAVINSRLVRVDADLKSLARVNADGSPIEVALAADDGSANFSGRLATAKVLSLAGPVSLSSPNPAPGLRLLGFPVPDSFKIAGPLTVDGALDGAGRAFAIRNATLALGDVHAAGDIAVDLRSEQPKLQASLAADAVWLDPFVPASGAANGDWGRVPLPFARLKDFDAEINIDARRLGYAGFTAGPSRLAVTLTGRKLETTGALRLNNNGTLSFTVKADATAIPPTAAMSLDAQGAEAQPLLAALTGVTQLTGTGDISADLTASGATQEELAGTLKGTARLALTAGSIAGVDLQGLFLAAKQKILDGWSAAPGATPFDTLNADADIADGIFTFRDLKIASKANAFTVEGIADVLRQGVAVSANATVNGQPLLPVPVIGRGLWAKPQIYPDIPNILTNPEGGFARLQDVAPLQGN